MTGFSAEVRALIDGRSGGMCEVCGERPAWERHHRRPRRSGGSRLADTNEASNGLAVCRTCHQMIEHFRKVALLLGWLIETGGSPANRRVMVRGVWRYLTDGGDYLEVEAA